MNPATCAAGEAFEEGEYCAVVLAVDERNRMPVQDDFFKGKSVHPDDRKKMHAALRNFSRTGPTSNTERYKYIDGIHYIKIHGFRAYCLERNRDGTREVVVCHVGAKKDDKALPASVTDKARRLFDTHCGRFP